jgi:uncharacterized protein involved in exopolysaccharide biosynthesis/Mrp family chromosome partitioning ATPase
MEKQLTEPAPVTFQLEDVYYTLFRHKWKIFICGLAGVAVAAILFKFQSPFFQSDAKLLVRYVVERRAPTAAAGEMKSPDALGETIMGGEASILKSFDLAQEVAESVGPEKILGMGEKTRVQGASKIAAAGAVVSGLSVEALKSSSIIAIGFQHKDPELVQPVLRHLIEAYFKKHFEIHRAVGMDDFLMQQRDQFRSQVIETEKELKTLKSSLGVVSIDKTENAYSDQISRIRQELFSAEAQLAESQAAFSRFTNRVSTKGEASVSELGISPQKLDEYRRVVGRLESFLKREQELVPQLTDKNPLVQEIRRQIDDAQREKNRLETEEPRFLRGGVQAALARGTEIGTGEDPATEASRIYSLEAKISVLKAQFEKVRAEAAAVQEVEGRIRDLERKKEFYESQYKSYASSLEQARLDEALGAGKLANISVIQAPTPPIKNLKKLYQQMAYALAGGLGVGLALAFLIEFLLDQTIRGSLQLERTLAFPVFLNIPLLPSTKPVHPTANGRPGDSSGSRGPSPQPGKDSAATPKLEGPLKPYYEALRDRLIEYFHVRQMTHKPKLIAVTGCLASAGVSTLAAGLAGSLSGIGEGNVLLVDMNGRQGRAYPFFHGSPSSDLNQVLEVDQRIDARVQDNLYVVSTASEDGAVFSPAKRFGQLIPKLRASDYDYIIFDMPPVSQTSITGKLAGHMDMMLLVIESEKTSRNLLARAASLLQESKVSVATILNKTRRYVPRWVHREYE